MLHAMQMLSYSTFAGFLATSLRQTSEQQDRSKEQHSVQSNDIVATIFLVIAIYLVLRNLLHQILQVSE